MNHPEVALIGRSISQAEKFLLVAHVRADGDAIGSLLGFGLALQENGKQVQMVLPDGGPSRYRHLAGHQLIKKKAEIPFDLSIVLDCSDLPRTGDVLDGRQPDINIDHHITNLKFARINLVLPEIAATSAILVDCLPLWGLPFSTASAEALLTGIVSDTLGFRTTNTTAHTLNAAAVLMEHGAPLADIYERELLQRSFESVRYWGKGLNNLQREGGLIWTALSLADRKEADYPGNDDADLVNILSSIEDYDMVIILTEQKNNHVKVSWRGRPGLDVSTLALQFNGGGHPAAAGADVVGTLPEVEERILQASRSLISSRSETH
jgi:phosphoesterase RecJ-like protein